ncbi:MAG: transposase [Fimbriimonadaceae bacterium]|nr:transposase [Chitinophagales bacterium]
MNFEVENLYHLYNRSNNNQIVFHHHENYIYFLGKIRKEWLPYFDIIAYCLMPTHFHFIVSVKGIQQKEKANYAVGKLLSSYTRANNKENNSHGSLFQQKTKSKNLHTAFDIKKYLNTSNYILYCLNYIHTNPLKDNLVSDLKDWQYSSYLDYAALRNGTLCNITIAEELLNFKRGVEFIQFTKLAENDYKF